MTDADDKTPPAGADLAHLSSKIAELSASLTLAQATVTEKETKIKELEGATGGLKTANGQSVARVTTLEAELATAQAALTAQAGELTTWSTKYGQLDEANKTQATEALASKKQLEMYGLIAAKPEFHGLVGDVAKLMGVVKADAPIADIEALLSSMATGQQAKVTAALEAYRAGATVPAGKVPGAAAAGALPTDPKAIHAEYQSLAGATLPADITRRAQLFEALAAVTVGDTGRLQN